MLSITPFPLHSFISLGHTQTRTHKYLKRIMIISFRASSGQIRQSCPNREPEDMEIGKRKILHILRLNRTTQILIYNQQDATLHSLSLETALHVSGGNSTHHQGLTQLYLQHLALVKLYCYLSLSWKRWDFQSQRFHDSDR